MDRVYEEDGMVYVQSGGQITVWEKQEWDSHISGAWDKHHSPFWFFCALAVVLVVIGVVRWINRRAASSSS